MEIKIPIFISAPNRCDGCPMEGFPIRIKAGNLCHKFQSDWDVKYGLNDYGHQICRVYKKIKDQA